MSDFWSCDIFEKMLKCRWGHFWENRLRWRFKFIFTLYYTLRLLPPRLWFWPKATTNARVSLHCRSYYRCTYAGCNVRKHVERSSTDSKAVITTYEGRHDHEIPAGRYGSSNHGTSTANAQQLKTRKITAKQPLQSRELEFGNQVPITLHLKEEQIAAWSSNITRLNE